MKSAIAIILVFCSFSGLSQNAEPLKVKLNDLYIPGVPGFILADKAPSSVEKPTTPRAFGLSILNLRQGGALEVTPYWLTNKPRYTFQDWVNKKNTTIETFNLSAATFKT